MAGTREHFKITFVAPFCTGIVGKFKTFDVQCAVKHGFGHFAARVTGYRHFAYNVCPVLYGWIFFVP